MPRNALLLLSFLVLIFFIYDGFVPFRTVIGKFVTCALAIGSGQSLGRKTLICKWAPALPPPWDAACVLSRDK